MPTYAVFLETGALYGVLSGDDGHVVVRAERGPLGLTLTPLEKFENLTDAFNRAAALN